MLLSIKGMVMQLSPYVSDTNIESDRHMKSRNLVNVTDFEKQPNYTYWIGLWNNLELEFMIN